MKERVERLAMEIREILGEIVTRQEIKDPRVQDAGLITITHVGSPAICARPPRCSRCTAPTWPPCARCARV